MLFRAIKKLWLNRERHNFQLICYVFLILVAENDKYSQGQK